LRYTYHQVVSLEKIGDVDDAADRVLAKSLDIERRGDGIDIGIGNGLIDLFVESAIFTRITTLRKRVLFGPFSIAAPADWPVHRHIYPRRQSC